MFCKTCGGNVGYCSCVPPTPILTCHNCGRKFRCPESARSCSIKHFNRNGGCTCDEHGIRCGITYIT